MLRLMLLRHSKAERAQGGERDHERRLAKRGRHDAPVVGAYMKKHGYRPDLAVVSTSKRTRETWGLVAEALDGKTKVDFEDRIYESTPADILKVVQETGKRIGTLLIVGHNPSLHELALQLIATGDIEARQRLQEGFPTSALAVIEFALENWERLHAHSGRLEHYVTPRLLAEADR
jgi:phosphohistidine phosphatase